ncbi:MAG: hypothetical protein Q9194_007598, partial [Teloschistes cf. exilis]
MADELNDYKKRAIPILTRENSERWFMRMKTFLISEDLFHYVETEPQLVGLAGTPAGSSTATPTIRSVTGFGNRKPNAKARHYIMMYIDEDDQDT